jgi:hypothetical protein
MKKIIVCIALLFVGLSQSQDINLIVNTLNSPSSQFSEWGDTNPFNLLVINNNSSIIGTDYSIKTKIYKDGNLVIETNANVNTYTFDNIGTEGYDTEDFLPYNALNFVSAIVDNELQSTGKLPAGMYEICFSILDTNNTIISTPAEVCQPFAITELQMPELLYPIDNLEIQAQILPALILRWSAITPMPSGQTGVKYIIAISKVEAGQSPSQAFHINYPIIEEEVLAGTQFFWPTDIDIPDETTQYVWSVKPLDYNDNPYISGQNGFVPEETFTVHPIITTSSSECSCTDGSLIPALGLRKPEATRYPKKVILTNVRQIQNHVVECIDDFNSKTYIVSTTIDWGTETQDLQNNGTYAGFTHTYAATESFPNEICITVSIDKRGTLNNHCSKEICIAVPDSFNTTDISNVATGNISINDTLRVGKNGEFPLIVQRVSQSGDSYSGGGTVFVDWLKARLSVSFTNIKIDTNKKLIQGAVLGDFYGSPAPVYPQDWATEVVTNNPWTNQAADDVVAWVENNSGQQVEYDQLNDYSHPLKLPLGVNLPSGDQIALTEVSFRPNNSVLNFVVAKNTPASWGTVQRVGFRAKNIYFHPNAFETPPERIELIQDVTLGATAGKIQYQFKAPSETVQGSYIAWNENGFSNFSIAMDVLFTREWFIPNPDTNTKTKVSLQATGNDWNNLLFTGNFEKATIVGTSGMQIQANNINYDMSDIANPPNMVFPENYPAGAEQSNLFRGFYMKNLNLELPDGWETNTGGKPEVSVHNMIINESGITLFAEANNVVQFPNANVADMGASIDTVYVNIAASELLEAKVTGRLMLPVSEGNTLENTLNYQGLFHTAQDDNEITNFQLNIIPDGPIQANLLKAKMTFDDTSNIVAYIDKNKKTFQATLNGQLDWEDVTIDHIGNIKMQLDFEGIELNYNSMLENNKLAFNHGTWSFASPSKFIANFPVTITAIDYHRLSTTGNQILHGKLDFDVVFNLAEDIGGETTLALDFGILEQNGTSITSRFKPEIPKAHIDEISLFAHLPAVSIDGTIVFRSNDEVFGNGFKGDVTASFKAPSVGIEALAEFGNTSYGHSSKYRYWRVEAAAKFETGIAFLPGLGFYGFGGGAYNNMEASIVYNTTIDSDVYTFTPKKGNFGLEVQATIGTMPKVDSFNADAVLSGQFSHDDGLINIGLSGKYYVGAPLLPHNEREEAQIKGSLIADYNFPNKHFYMNVSADIEKAPAIVAHNQRMVLDINGRTNKWFFKFGEPSNMNRVNVYGANVYEYLMFGNDIQAPRNGFSDAFREAYKQAVPSHTYPGIPTETGVNNNTMLGKGFALGLGFEFHADEEFTVSGAGVSLNMDAGAELNLSMMKYLGQNCANPSQRVGFNGYRAKGNIAYYIDAALNVSYQSRNYPLANIKSGGWLSGEFPRPTHFAGRIEGDIRIGRYTTKKHLLGHCNHCSRAAHSGKKDGHRTNWTKRRACNHRVAHYLLKTRFDQQFTWGDNCSVSNGQLDTSGENYSQGDATAQYNTLIDYVQAIPRYNYPKNKPIAVRYVLPINESFDIAEQQADGSIINRTFRLTTIVKMYKYKKATQSYQEVTIETDEDNLGNYLYTYVPPFVNTAEITTQINNWSAVAVNNTQANTNIANMEVSSTETSYTAIQNTNFTMYPAPSSSASDNEYAQLEEAEIVSNKLEENQQYKIEIEASLLEYTNSWQVAKKANGQAIKTRLVRVYSTGDASKKGKGTRSFPRF